MSLPIFLHSAMAGAPALSAANGSINALLNACLVNGFNTQSVVSATASGGVVTFNFASAPGFGALDTVTISGASNAVVNGQFRAQSAASNQVLVSIPGVPDGAVGGTLTMQFSALGWARPYAGTSIGCYQQGGASAVKRLLRVYDGALSSTAKYWLRGYESMTDASAGSDPFPTVAQKSGDGVAHWGPHGSAVNPPWALIGTPRAFYFMCAYDGSYAVGAPLSVNNIEMAFFGDLDRPQKIGDTYACAVSAVSSFPSAASSLYVARSHSSAPGAVVASLLSPTTYAGLGDALSPAAAAPGVVSGYLTFADAWAVLETGLLRGFMPGNLSCWQNLRTGDAVLRPAVPFELISGVEGRLISICTMDNTYSGGALLLDEDWGDA